MRKVCNWKAMEGGKGGGGVNGSRWCTGGYFVAKSVVDGDKKNHKSRKLVGS